MASATSMAVGRRGGPLKTMCSRKWASPLVRSASPREPAHTKTLTLTDWAVGRGVVTTRRPPSRLLISQVALIGASIAARPLRGEGGDVLALHQSVWIRLRILSRKLLSFR